MRAAPASLGGRALFVGHLASFEELARLSARYNVSRAVIDAFPEQRPGLRVRQAEAAKSLSPVPSLLRPQRHRAREGLENSVRIYHLNRTQAIEEMFGSFEAGLAELPQISRYLDGRMRNGLGDCYRQMTALIRILEKNAAGNLVALF
jgi:hypothetical protein